MSTALFLASLFAPPVFVLAGVVVAMWPACRRLIRGEHTSAIAQPVALH
jgi:hypothetical protein